jgi:hypothetical protein
MEETLKVKYDLMIFICSHYDCMTVSADGIQHCNRQSFEAS